MQAHAGSYVMALWHFEMAIAVDHDVSSNITVAIPTLHQLMHMTKGKS